MLQKTRKSEKKNPVSGVKFEIRNISPKDADKWLDSNTTRQRPLSKVNVRKWTDAMLDGQWMFDGAPIRFDKNGNLIDGQHRLHALIKANCTLPFLVVTGLNKETFRVMDTGQSRTVQHMLHIDGFSHIKGELARLLRLVVASNFGDRNYRRALSSNHIRTVNNLDMKAAFELLSDDLIKFAEKFKSKEYFNTKRLLGAGDAAYFNWVMDELDSELATTFFYKLETGEGLTQEDPVLTLRNKLIIDASLVRNTQHVKILKAAYLTKTWNAARRGRTLKVLRYSDTEDFPELI